jgi:hypothetical protein
VISVGAVLYVHVADDGGVLVVDGDSGQSAWVVVAELRRRLEALQEEAGSVLLSRESGSPIAEPVLELIRRAGVPVGLTREVHPDAIRSGGATALMAAVYVGADLLAHDLIVRGADVDRRDQEGYTALMYASNAGQEGMVKTLLDAGADANAFDNAGSTPVMFAAQHGYAGIVKRLLIAGANPGRRRGDGLSAWDFAAQNGHDRLAGILLSAEGSRS